MSSGTYSKFTSTKFISWGCRETNSWQKFKPFKTNNLLPGRTLQMLLNFYKFHPSNKIWVKNRTSTFFSSSQVHRTKWQRKKIPILSSTYQKVKLSITKVMKKKACSLLYIVQNKRMGNTILQSMNLSAAKTTGRKISAPRKVKNIQWKLRKKILYTSTKVVKTGRVVLYIRRPTLPPETSKNF